MVWFGVPREMLVLFDFGPRETYFSPKLAYASRGGTTDLEAYHTDLEGENPSRSVKKHDLVIIGNQKDNLFMKIYVKYM